MSSTHAVISDLQKDEAFMKGVRLWRTLEEKPAQLVNIPAEVHTQLYEALVQRGAKQLYSHQAETWNLVRAGLDALVVTPTASGKSLCYNLPVLNSILAEPHTRALYVFPTKALSQDQQAELTELSLVSALGIKISTYDGDTPDSLRASARETAQIIITNCDMLHAGVLPNHPRWVKFFKNLRFLVLDEMHTYSGLHGSHVANVLRRLLRICAFYGSKPQIIACSATIGNPHQLAVALTGRNPVLVDRNGAPSGKKHLVLYNPPLLDAVQGIRVSTVNESKALALATLRHGIKTIVFARSRIRVELIADYLRSSLASHYEPEKVPRVEAYRGGYLPNERRSIEKGLRDGSIQAVVSTNALELGIDIGGLDAAILAGFPGSVSSVWQQAGRAGRRAGESLALVVASSNPLDQYLVQHPEYFMGRSPEHAYINPLNHVVYSEHIKCAAFELPFSNKDEFFPDANEVLPLLTEAGLLRFAKDRWYWADRSYPAEGISLRGADGQNVVIIDKTEGSWQVIGEMDRSSAKEMLFPEAVYLHRGRHLMVHELDLEENRAIVSESTLNYYTDGVVKRDLEVLWEDHASEIAGIQTTLGDILVRSQVSKYKKLRFHTHENLGYGDVFLPEDELHTRYLALRFTESTKAGQAFKTLEPGVETAVLARLGTLIKSVAPAFLLCKASDFGVSERLRDPHFDEPVVYLFDRSSGGSGLAEASRLALPEILKAAKELVLQCTCKEGCPSCIGPRNVEEECGLDPKAGMRRLLQNWLIET